MDGFELILWAGGLIVAAIGGAFAEHNRRHRPVTHKNSSVLMAYYTENATALPLARAKIAGLRHSSILFTRGSMEAILVSIDLPFVTNLHMVGIPKTDGVVPLNPAAKTSSIMEKVDLEGDYPNYFTLYAEKGQQQEARYLFDPKAMGFTVDFCRSHNWEIIGDMLLFVSTSGTSRKNDPTMMWDDIDDFVEQIRPAIEVPLTPEQERARTPQNEDYRESLPCPICNNSMQNKQNHFLCNNGHGALIKGGFLKQLREEKLVIKTLPLEITKEMEREAFARPALTCPSCNGQMQKVRYNMGDITIDACSECTYRWLDAHELTLQP